MKKGIIFDLDGTLWDTTNSTYESLKEICKKHNIEEVSIDKVKKAFGTNIEETAQIYFPNLELEEGCKLVDENTINHVNYLNVHGGILYDGVKEIIVELSKQYKLFIVSNTAQIEYIEAFLKTSSLDKYFDDYIAASALHMSKSDAIKKVMQDNNISDAVYVGDTQKDMESSLDANLPFIYASYGFGSVTKCAYKLNNPTDLNILLNNLNYKNIYPDKIGTTPGGTLTQVFGASEGASKSIALVTMDEASEGLKHYHDNITEIYLFTSGKGQIIINGNINEINGPSVYIIPNNNVHYIKSITKMEFACICTPPWEEQHEFVSDDNSIGQNIEEYKNLGKLYEDVTLYEINQEYAPSEDIMNKRRVYYILEGKGLITVDGITNYVNANNCYEISSTSKEVLIPNQTMKFVIITEEM